MPMHVQKYHRWFQWLAIPFISLGFHIHYRMKITGREHIPAGGCVVCPNHSGLSDPPLAAVGLGHRCPLRIMAKKELFEHALLGPLISWLGAFPVDRDRADIGAIKTALQAVKDGYKFLIFPQGTRDAAEGDAKEGAAMLAVRTKAPLVPVYITDQKKKHGRVHIVIGQPFLPDEALVKNKDYQAISQDILQRIYALKPEEEA